MKEIKQILSEIVNHLERQATQLGAMEEALIGHELISSSDIDSHMGVLSAPHTSAKHKLVNLRYQISKLPD